MAYIGPWSNFHELNLDWILREVKKLRTDIDGMMGASTPSDSAPEMDGTADPGSSINYSRGDHVHPSDTSRASASDLAQEVSDREGADLLLQGNIDTVDGRVTTVDAKIVLSNTAPLMDSSSATAGTSTEMSRSDHVHPTDTSRASKSEFDTLKATVDGMSGSASPYDSTPEMDGVASAGVVGAYARGDHVHPADTTKLDVTGGTVTGRIIETQKERYASVSSIGWLRIADCPIQDGSMVRFWIVRKSENYPSECHAVTLCVNLNSIDFVDEMSEGDVLYLDKIRLTDAGKIDIHMDQAYESYIGVRIERLGSESSDTEDIKMLPIISVADAPAGESILKTYTFLKNYSMENGVVFAEYQFGDISVNANSYQSVPYTDVSSVIPDGYEMKNAWPRYSGATSCVISYLSLSLSPTPQIACGLRNLTSSAATAKPIFVLVCERKIQ